MTEQPTDPTSSEHGALPDEPIPDAGGGTDGGSEGSWDAGASDAGSSGDAGARPRSGSASSRS